MSNPPRPRPHHSLDEWAHLKDDEIIKHWSGRYAELGTMERAMPFLFALLHLALIVVGFR